MKLNTIQTQNVVRKISKIVFLILSKLSLFTPPNLKKTPQNPFKQIAEREYKRETNDPLQEKYILIQLDDDAPGHSKVN